LESGVRSDVWLRCFLLYSFLLFALVLVVKSSSSPLRLVSLLGVPFYLHDICVQISGSPRLSLRLLEFGSRKGTSPILDVRTPTRLPWTRSMSGCGSLVVSRGRDEVIRGIYNGSRVAGGIDRREKGGGGGGAASPKSPPSMPNLPPSARSIPTTSETTSNPTMKKRKKNYQNSQ
jgi:hypothetical protein